MEKIYLITERCGSFGQDERIIAAVHDKAFAKRYCRDMRTGGKLTMHEVDCDTLTMPKEKLYRVEYENGFVYNDDDDITEVYHELVKEEPVAYLEDADWLTIAYAAIRVLRMVNDSYYGTKLVFWCCAKSADGAKAILRKLLADYDVSKLEWGLYMPTEDDGGLIKKRIRYYNRIYGKK